jgi:hypothetical protein
LYLIRFRRNIEIKYVTGKEYKNADGLLRLPTLAAATWIAVKDVRKNFLKLLLKKQLQNDLFFGNIYRYLEQRHRHPNLIK